MHIEVMLSRRRFAAYCGALVFLVGFSGDWLKILGLEDLPAIEALHVVHAISAGEDNRLFMLAGVLHNQHLGIWIL
jgi:hypothetical protein